MTSSLTAWTNATPSHRAARAVKDCGTRRIATKVTAGLGCSSKTFECEQDAELPRRHVSNLFALAGIIVVEQGARGESWESCDVGAGLDSQSTSPGSTLPRPLEGDTDSSTA